MAMMQVIPLVLENEEIWRMIIWAADQAESVLPLFEAAAPDDLRPRQALAAIRAARETQDADGLIAAYNATVSAVRPHFHYQHTDARWAAEAVGELARQVAHLLQPDVAWVRARADLWYDTDNESEIAARAAEYVAHDALTAANYVSELVQRARHRAGLDWGEVAYPVGLDRPAR